MEWNLRCHSVVLATGLENAISIRGAGQGFEKLKLISHAIELQNSITSR